MLRIRIPIAFLPPSPGYPPNYIGAAPSGRYLGVVGWLTLYLGAL